MIFNNFFHSFLFQALRFTPLLVTFKVQYMRKNIDIRLPVTFLLMLYSNYIRIQLILSMLIVFFLYYAICSYSSIFLKNFSWTDTFSRCSLNIYEQKSDLYFACSFFIPILMINVSMCFRIPKQSKHFAHIIFFGLYLYYICLIHPDKYIN